MESSYHAYGENLDKARVECRGNPASSQHGWRRPRVFRTQTNSAAGHWGTPAASRRASLHPHQPGCNPPLCLPQPGAGHPAAAPPPDLSRCLHLLPRGHRTLANDLRRVQVRYDRLYPCPRVFQAGTCGRPWCQSGKTRPYRVTSAGAPRLLSLHLTDPPPTRLVRLPRVSSAHTAPTEPSGG